MKAGKKSVEFTDRPPQYPEECKDWPVFYGTEHKVLDNHHVTLKLYNGRSYVYRKVVLSQPFVAPPGYSAGSPTLVREAYGWELHVPIVLTQSVDLRKVAVLVQDQNLRICMVDLGMNHHAVATIQDTEGRVYATLFIPGSRDNRLRKRYLERIVALQRETGVAPNGERFAKDLWDKISNLNDYIAHYVSKQIVDFAAAHDAKVMVFEYLGNLRPDRGTRSHWLNQKFMFWVKGRIFRYSQYKGLHRGIVTCRVNPKNTSARCPYCGQLTIERYNKGRRGIALARCGNCGVHGVNADFVGSLGVGTAFRLRHCS